MNQKKVALVFVMVLCLLCSVYAALAVSNQDAITIAAKYNGKSNPASGQCKGFVQFVYKQAFGSGKTDIVPSTNKKDFSRWNSGKYVKEVAHFSMGNSKAINIQNLKNFFAKLSPGDAVQMDKTSGTSCHTFIFVKVNSSGSVTAWHANWHLNNKVSTDSLSWDTLLKFMGTTSKGMTAYRYINAVTGTPTPKPTPTPAPAVIGDVVFFEHTNRQGWSKSRSANFNAQTADAMGFNNDQLSCVQIYTSNVTVELYSDANYKGKCVKFSAKGVYNLPDYSFNDVCSSYKIYKGTGVTPTPTRAPSADAQVTFCGDRDGNGWNVKMSVGFNAPNAGSLGFSNDQLSSIRIPAVSGGQIYVTVYENENYSGRSQTFNGEGLYNLEPFGLDNTCSSYKIYKQ